MTLQMEPNPGLSFNQFQNALKNASDQGYNLQHFWLGYLLT